MSTLLQSAASPRSQGYGTLNADKRTGKGVVNASFFSKLLFSYVYPLFEVGNERQLHMDDMWELEGNNRAAAAFEHYNRHFAKHNRSVGRAIIAAYGLPFVVCGLGALFAASCAVFAPVVLHHVIDAFTAPQIDVEDLTLWLSAFFASRLLNAIVSAHMGFYLEVVALRMTVALKSLVFRKAVRRSSRSKGDAKAVDISNLYTSDVDNVLWAAFQINNLWILPIQIGVVVYLLYDVIDAAAFAGLGVIGLSMILSLVIAVLSGGAFQDIMKRKDERMKVIKEVFGAIQIIKLNAWEDKFASKISALRAFELQAVARFLYITAASIFMLWASPIFVSMTSFAVYTLVMDQALTAAKVFTAIALFNAIRDPLRDLPNVIQQCIQAKVSLSRMAEFLAIDEYDASNVTREDASQPDDVVVAIKNGSFGWSADAPVLLQNVNLRVKRGDLVVVHGAVGAGKSTLCAALLGETEKLSGNVFVRGKVAYYSQQAWIQNMTIRENILFGNAFDAARYQRVLDACGLLPDLAGFPGGDATEIGQKGVNLSGGQKARLCLARACYSDADLLILDSPLAAVDAVVQSEIFGKCICTLLERQTVVLVTHSPDIITSEAANVKVLVQDATLTVVREEVAQSRRLYAPTLSPRKVQEAHAHESEAAKTDAGRLVNDEEREEGRVSKAVFLQYLRSVGGVKMCALLLAVQTLWQAFQIGSDLWLSHWTGQKIDDNGNGDSAAAMMVFSEADTVRNMRIYALLGGGAALMVLARAVTISCLGLRGSRQLFDAMTRSLLRAPLQFFDSNPIGRIVNRYSDDVSAVDFQLPFAFGTVSAIGFFTICQLATAVYMVRFLGVLILPLAYVYMRVGNFYLAPSREVSRLWKVADSPLLSHVAEIEDGVALVRAFGAAYTERTLAENLARLDAINRIWMVMNTGRQWFQIRMQLIGCGVVVVIVSGLVYLHVYLSPGVVGLAFSYALSVDGSIASLVQVWSWLEMLMVSPERIAEYSALVPEGAHQLLALEPPTVWPQSGAITFQDVVFSYKPGAPAVLKGLSFDIKAGEKVGIVGRTGAGKSSLTMALFRIHELDAGRIVVDGEDISSLPLRTLRSRLSIIPQAPVLFKGTLRAYMDPFDDFNDAQIWAVLHKVEMKEQVAALEQQLAHELSENGENFSVGERQLLCMARALLTQSRIVVMDEATAAIDHATERTLQAMIAREFQSATVLTIAHRLATVLDSDRVMVLRDGRVVEFDATRTLVQNPNGAFYELAKEGGYLDRLL